MSRPGEHHELELHLLQRDLLSACRHALALHEDSDGVEICLKLNSQGFALDVTHTRGKLPLSGWGI